MVNLKTDLFSLAEKRLQTEKQEGKIPCYTALDVLEYAIEIRKWLDKHPKGIFQYMKLAPRDKIRYNKEYQHKYYLQRTK